MELSILSLVFERDSRPDVRTIAGLAERSGQFSVSSYPVERAREDWLELVRNGLAFDLRGLAPGEPEYFRPELHPGRLGNPPGALHTKSESLILVPGPHLAGGESMLPVIRSQMALGLHLSRLPGVTAIGWAKAGTLSDPRHFAKAIDEWLRGGAYPGDLLGADPVA